MALKGLIEKTTLFISASETGLVSDLFMLLETFLLRPTNRLVGSWAPFEVKSSLKYSIAFAPIEL